MVRKELIRRSPLRILERSTQGGLGTGNLGVIAGRKGIGKTACLVHIATDALFQERHVIHVSFSADTRHIVSWYDEIYEEIARRYQLEQVRTMHDELVRHRIIMNFNQDGIRLPQVMHSVQAMIRDAGFSARTIIVDGYDFARTSREELAEVHSFAAELGLEIWFSVTLRDEKPVCNDSGVPLLLEPVLDELAVLICLHPGDNHVHLQLVKDHDTLPVSDLHLKLDPHLMLIQQEK